MKNIKREYLQLHLLICNHISTTRKLYNIQKHVKNECSFNANVIRVKSVSLGGSLQLYVKIKCTASKKLKVGQGRQLYTETALYILIFEVLCIPAQCQPTDALLNLLECTVSGDRLLLVMCTIHEIILGISVMNLNELNLIYMHQITISIKKQIKNFCGGGHYNGSFQVSILFILFLHTATNNHPMIEV